MSEAIAYAIEIARGLGCAHEGQIVHRDVKPQNVLVDEEGAAKVTDFGIARSLAQEGLTADGRVLGTTDYVSPEQALGHVVSGQSDLYSLGIVLFEMLTGDVPFKGENQVAVAMKHVREELPDVQIRRPEVSAALAAVLDRATAKELDRRYPDAASLITDLEDVLAIETSRTRPGHGRGDRRPALPARNRASGCHCARGARRRRSSRCWRSRSIALAVTLGLGLPRPSAGPASATTSRPRAGLQDVPLGQRAARDFDPPGDKARARRRDERRRRWRPVLDVVDRGLLQRPAEGRRRDRHRRLAERRGAPVRAAHADVGLRSDDLRRAGPTPATAPPKAGRRSARRARSARDEKFDLDTAGQRFRRYLVWITQLRRTPSARRSPRSCCSSRSHPGRRGVSPRRLRPVVAPESFPLVRLERRLGHDVPRARRLDDLAHELVPHRLVAGEDADVLATTEQVSGLQVRRVLDLAELLAIADRDRVGAPVRAATGELQADVSVHQPDERRAIELGALCHGSQASLSLPFHLPAFTYLIPRYLCASWTTRSPCEAPVRSLPGASMRGRTIRMKR